MDQNVAAVRAFNRFYTREVGALRARFLDGDMTLPEARILFELGQGKPVLASDLVQRLDMDAAQLSRTLTRFARKGWVERSRGAEDGRARPLSLTPEGREIFRHLDARQRDATAAMLAPLDPWGVRDATEGLTLARLRLAPDTASAVTLRTFRTGDVGMLAARQSLLYQEEWNWGQALEALVTETAAQFLRNFRPGRDQCWIAELDGVMAGSVMLTDEGDGTARLRLLYVEPFARQRGIAGQLVATAICFARKCGQQRIVLWTHTVLETARRLYAAKGFRLTDTTMHHHFGEPIQGETWVLDLTQEHRD